MNLLITTSYSVLELNTKNGCYRRIHQGKGLYYGIAVTEDKIFVAARNRMVSSDKPTEDERGEILVFGPKLKLEGRVKPIFPLRDMHQIAWHEGKLWVICSYDNLIAIWDGREWEQWFPLGETQNSQKDMYHYNSFLFEDGVLWVLAHNRGPSELLAFSLVGRNLIKRIELGNHAHNIWREDGQLFTCSSVDGKIVGEYGFAIETGGFPRGYVSVNGERCVGVSELAERKYRDLSTATVRVYDRSWNFIKMISLHKEGLVLDFAILERGRDCFWNFLPCLRQRFINLNRYVTY